MHNTRTRTLFYDLMFLLVLLVAAYFRLSGLNWDQNQHLHPDERFMTMVESALIPVHNLSEYFDTDNSTLNPHNRGYTFYVYGDLPIFMVRYAAEWMSSISASAAQYVQINGTGGFFGPLMALLGKTVTWAGYDEVTLVGRVLAAFSDLGSIVLLYLIAARLYDRKVATLAAAFSSLAVMQIQQSHFFTVDMFANFFMFLATYFAVRIMKDNDSPQTGGENNAPEPAYSSIHNPLALFFNPIVWDVLGFGLALGASVASKINAAPLAVLLPGALLIRYFSQTSQAEQSTSDPANPQASIDSETPDEISETGSSEAQPAQNLNRRAHFSIETILVLLILGALASILAFRVFMPYAFSGPSFFNMLPNPKWVANITQQRAQASGDVDFPPALQWARRSFWFSGYNLVAWGLGWPLGLLALAGAAYMAWRILRGEWREHALLWVWTAGYFVWQSTQWNPTMRYQLPIYPLLALMASWFIFNGPRGLQPIAATEKPREPHFAFRVGYALLAFLVLTATFAWAYAFSMIYTRDHSRVQATRWIYQNIPGPYNLKIQQADGSTFTQPMSIPNGSVITPVVPYDSQFTASASGNLTEILIAHAVNQGNPAKQTLVIGISNAPGVPVNKLLAQASLTSDFSAQADPRGESYTLKFDRPVMLEKDRIYFLRFITSGALGMQGSSPIQESTWDDGLPLRMDGYDAFGGMYQGGLIFEMYWDDTPEKRTRFEGLLDAGDYLFITSNRQFATTTRLPERYPLTTHYYRELLGCPADKEIIWCYNVAVPGKFTGNLGFELVQTFTSYPELFGRQFNTQFAEEAFTVYDTPKVLIFKKTAGYDPKTVRSLLRSVDLAHVVHLTPRQAARYPGDLMLPADRLSADRAGGTWSELFSYESLQNKYPILGLVIWYVAIGLLGLFTWPILRLLLPGLADGGYPLARLSGLLLLAYLVWLFASLGGQYSRPVIAVVYVLIVILGAFTYLKNREKIGAEIRAKGKYFFIVEGLFLAFFLFDLAIRLGNPDLWHPARGGERPMDFAYLNAIIKSTSFPPYDPWFAGGYINYYYWGFVLVGTPVKLLGIVPSIAYNFILPTFFALLGIGGFSVVWNMISALQDEDRARRFPVNLPVVAGIAAGAGLVLLGNLGTIQLIYHALQKMTVPNQLVDAQDVLIFQRWAWAAQGIAKLFSGAKLPIGWGEYYWAPSRVMPLGDLAITEFPLFTFLYSDLHAHMIALPLTVLAIAWTLSTLLARKLSRWGWLGTLLFGGLVIGVLRPTNTWDFPTYLALGTLVTGYSVFRYVNLDILQSQSVKKRLEISPIVLRLILAGLAMGLLVGFAVLLYQPFANWYGLAYSQVSQWKNQKTPIWSYWTQWGLFLFVILSWMLWETRQWLAQTPVSSLAKLKPYQVTIELGIALLVVIYLALQFMLDVPIAWFAFPVAVWALLLMFRPGQPDAKRLVLFMIGTGTVLTLAVEMIVLVGDIGRMNTVFKFYLQVWVLFAVSSAAALGWILTEFDEWGRIGKIVFQVFGGLLLACAALFTFTASMDKVRDRMTTNVPFTFDSMTYMKYSFYGDNGATMDLSEDYRAIRWLQDNVKGSPVVLEAAPAGIQYTWFSRISIYTGLPTVVGWQWHQEQQRALLPQGTVAARGIEAQAFYRNNDITSALAFLKKYDVRYIVVGQQERIRFPEGLWKFEAQNGKLWKEVYRQADTVIYEVLP